MRTIRISDAVWDAIVERGRFNETADDVLRRELGLRGANLSERRLVAPGRKGRGSVRYATKRMSPRVAGNELEIRFEDGAANKWRLPSRSDKSAIRLVTDEAVTWAKEQGATDPGQTNAIRKTLTDAGYHLRR